MAAQQIEKALDWICAHRRPPSPPPSSVDQRYAAAAPKVAAACGGPPTKGICTETTSPKFFCSNDTTDIQRFCPQSSAHTVCSFGGTNTVGCYSATAYLGQGNV